MLKNIVIHVDDVNTLKLKSTRSSVEDIEHMLQAIGEDVLGVDAISCETGRPVYYRHGSGWEHTPSVVLGGSPEDECLTQFVDELDLIGQHVYCREGSDGVAFGYGEVISYGTSKDGAEQVLVSFPMNNSCDLALTSTLNLSEIVILPRDILMTIEDHETGDESVIDVTEILIDMVPEDVLALRDGTLSDAPEVLRSVVGASAGEQSFKIAESISDFYGGRPIVDLRTGEYRVPETIFLERLGDITQRSNLRREFMARMEKEHGLSF